MKNPLLFLVPALFLSVAANAAGESCPADWGKLRPWDLGADGIKKLKPVAINSCADLASLTDPKKFWDIRKKLIAMPEAKGGKEPVTFEALDPLLKTAVLEADAPQYFTAYERFRIKNILLGKSLCDVAVGGC